MAARDDIHSTEAEDRLTESAVLQHVLAMHPGTATSAEILREVAGEDPSFEERDAVERALRELSGAGLLRLADGIVLPSRAALRFDELLGE